MAMTWPKETREIQKKIKKHASNATKSVERGVLFEKLEIIGYTANARH
jgi:hypothetical protein